MRYQITADNNPAPLARASNRKQADSLFEEAKIGLPRGSTITLVLNDRGKSSILRTYHRDTLEEVLAEQERAIDRILQQGLEARAVLDKFITDLQKNLDTFNPGYSFRWADSAFAAVAKYEAALALRELRDTKHSTIEELHAYFLNRTLQGAAHPSFGSSQCANLHAQHTTAAYAELARELTDIMRWSTQD